MKGGPFPAPPFMIGDGYGDGSLCGAFLHDHMAPAAPHFAESVVYQYLADRRPDRTLSRPTAGFKMGYVHLSP